MVFHVIGKKAILFARISTFNKSNAANITFQVVTFSHNNIYIVVVYIPPKFAIEEALKCLKDILITDRPTIIVGDFNQFLGNNNF